ncbi:MAG TPA: DNA polymerase ligase N-terminal domain-containing protein [candidate division Zixibacteria bacterium]|nr:DNA polymerase ligase N-terminal domain-containing protein [candidate division Zixibacteria bacterium]
MKAGSRRSPGGPERLSEYRSRRRFDVTPEPEGGSRRSSGRREFVVQKHCAGHLHYDFRLEHDGVMLSWAVPKGPALDPAVKRLAMQTEDHPIEYNRFEGVIPEGEYGAGTVMVWDRGVWEPETADVDAALEKGEIKFTLYGEKLKGSWAMVRMRDRQWLLIKHRDEQASTTDITATEPRSVLSGRTLAEIAEAEGASPRQIARARAADAQHAALRSGATRGGAPGARRRR